MISVLVPYRPDGGHRDRAWAWNRERWEGCAVELIVEADDGGAHPGEFNHPRAINRAAARAAGDVFVVADADTTFDPDWVYAAARLIRLERARWVLPLRYHKLTRESTERLLRLRDPGDPIGDYECEWRGEGINWSGLVAVSREGFTLVGGYDERIAWWGADDVCFGLTMDALVGRHHRLPGAAMHLWHPQPPEHFYGHERHARQQALVDRYVAAADDPVAIQEVRFG